MLAITLLFLLAFPGINHAQKLLIFMDLEQSDHLKAYGVAFWCLQNGHQVEWLLNYRGGSFMTDDWQDLRNLCRLRGVAFSPVTAEQAGQIYQTIEQSNMDVIMLEKTPRLAVYVPTNREPWDDAVRLALDYAEISYTTLWDAEVLHGDLFQFDWLHLHHEDFSGQYGKFFGTYRNAPWYRAEVAACESEAKKLGFHKVSEAKKAVARAIKQYIYQGGFVFAMCSAPETMDLALAAEQVDIVTTEFDGDPPDQNYNRKLDYSRTLAFSNFVVYPDALDNRRSSIDTTPDRQRYIHSPQEDYFTLFDFSAKLDPVPTMLVQDHVNAVPGFLGLTTAFRKALLKKYVTILAEVQEADEVRYLHGNFGQGTFTFYGGHDPEDYQHFIGDPPTDLSLHKNSPGYRLILNNILFPAARKKERKT